MGGWGFLEAGSVSSTRVPCLVLSAQVRTPCPELGFLWDFVDEAGICLTQGLLEGAHWLIKRPLRVGTARGNTGRIGAAQGPSGAPRSDVGGVRSVCVENVSVADLCKSRSLASFYRKSQYGAPRALWVRLGDLGQEA